MDAFYAAVEVRDDPSLVGKPVIIGGSGSRGVVSTASYEARRYGVHSAMPGVTARRICPHGIFLAPRMSAYIEESRRIREIFDSYTPLVEPLSLDEAFLDVTGSRRLFGDGRTIAASIRERVLETTGLTVSVGVAAMKFVAKIASDLEKPDGLVVVPPGTERAFLAPLALSRLWGAGKASRERLEPLGVKTIGDILKVPESLLRSKVGQAAAARFASLAAGRDERIVVTSRPARSISRETTFEQSVESGDDLRSVLLGMAESVGRRARRSGVRGATIRLKLRYDDFTTLTRQETPDPPTSDDVLIWRTAVALLDRHWSRQRSVRLIGVGLADLRDETEGVQASLFEGESVERSDRALDAMDGIREKFGRGAIGHGDTAIGSD